MTMAKQARFAFPLIVFLLIVVVLWRGLSLHPNQVPSPLINKAAPNFQLPTLENGNKFLTNKNFLGQVTLLNVWATWCVACAEEHDFLLHLANDEKIIIYGFDYKDDPAAAKKILQEHGNPYKIIGVDQSGNVAIDWGVYGTPETFVIDKKGIIRYKQLGPITEQVWNENLKPLIEKLRNESA